jgi:hypothetical protein
VTVSFGSHDVILLYQDKYELRKLRKVTVFPRCIGPYTDWEAFFDSQQEIYIMLFTLHQQTGSSNSYYSLKSQF